MAKIKDIKSQNPDYVIDLVDILAENDPTKTNKYLPFMVSQTKDWLEWFLNELKNNTFKEMFDIVKEFEGVCDKVAEHHQINKQELMNYFERETIEQIG